MMDETRSEPSLLRKTAPAGRAHRLISVHHAFLLGILFKGVDGLLEIAGAVLAYFVTPIQLRGFIARLTSHELSQDPHDFIATHVMQFAAAYSYNTKLFFMLYLLSHGVVKLFLVISLWQRRLWAYPAAIVVFALFIVYQTYEYMVTYAIGYNILSALDVIVIILTLMEYKTVKRDVLARRQLLKNPDSSVL